MKGMVTFDRKTKKDSYFWYKANWSEDPVLYLTQRRNVDREKKVTSITVYSNIGEPKVFLNGQELSGIHKGYTDVHYIIDNVIEWMYTGEKKREADSFSIKGVHAGFE